MLSADQIRQNLAAVEQRISAACRRADRHRSTVTLVAVSKTFPAAAVEAAIAAGATDVGENRVQEGREKRPQVQAQARWHLIGHLQSNKAKDAVRHFDVIHSVDSLALAQRISRLAAEAGKRQQVLIEVNIGREAQKSGAGPDEVRDLVGQIGALEHLDLRGLMCIPPLGDPEGVRPYFQQMRALGAATALPELSMGMTDDFEVAIEEGATIIRVGRAIFGSRG